MYDQWVRPAAWQNGVYLANAAAGLSPAPVIEAVTRHLRREAEIGVPAAAAEAGERMSKAYQMLAQLLNAAVSEVAFVESGNRGLQTLIASMRLQAGDRVLVDRGVWGGTLAMLGSLGVKVEVMPWDRFGRVDPAVLAASIDGNVKLVLVTWCPSISGVMNPAKAVGEVLQGSGIVYLLDACQAVGQIPADVQTIGCDALVASGRKWLRGPRGTAVLFASRAFLDRFEPYMADQFGSNLQAGTWQPREDARRYETGDSYLAGRLGLGSAIEGALALDVAATENSLRKLAARLRQGLSQIEGVVVHEDGPDLSAIVTFSIEGLTAALAAQQMAARHVVVSDMRASYGPFDMDARGLTDLIRAAPQLYTSDDDVDQALEIVAGMAPRRR